jgi:hypothetical protein
VSVDPSFGSDVLHVFNHYLVACSLFYPSQTARFVAYVAFFVFFLAHYYKHREVLLKLHSAFLLIFMFAMIEGAMWLASYQYLNITGTPYCCPFPPVVVGALVLQVFRQTFSRAVFLVVSLGYGIVRPKLMVMEWIAIYAVSILYLLSAILSQVAIIMFAEHAQGGYGPSSSEAAPYSAPEIFMDVLFLSWIYLSLGSTVRILTDFQQTAKLDMYNQLLTIIGVFVAAFVTITMLFVMSKCSPH